MAKASDIAGKAAGQTVPADVVDSDDSTFGSWAADAFDQGWQALLADGFDSGFSGGEVILTVSDLVSDSNNEVVIMADRGMDMIRLVADCAVAGSGLTEAHVMADGQDVTGYHYVNFDSGLTLYYDDGVNVVIDAAGV